MIPTKEECYELFRECGLPQNVIEHCEAVTKVAVFLAKKLVEAGENVNIDLVTAGGLLHDIYRHKDFKDYKEISGVTQENIEFQQRLHDKYHDIDHGIAGYLEMKDKYPEVAWICKRHFQEFLFKEGHERIPQTWEEKLVLYADKRVAHSKILSIQERLDELSTRHFAFFERIGTNLELMKQGVRELEKEIFEKIEIKPEDVKMCVENEQRLL